MRIPPTSAAPAPPTGGLVVLCADALATPFRRWLGRAVIVGFFALTGGSAVVDRFWPYQPVPLAGDEQAEDGRRHREAAMRDGTQMKMWESDLRRTSRVGAVVAPPYAALRYRVRSVSNAATLCGPDGWLFSRDRVTISDPDPATLPDRLATALCAVDRRLGTMGIGQVVFMLVPRKEVVHGDRLPHGVDVRPELDAQLQAAMERRRLLSPDLLALARAAPGMNAYQITDTHWTDDAAVASVAAAVRVAGLGVADPATRPALQDLGFASLPGDLTRYAGLVRDDDWDPLGVAEARHFLRTGNDEPLCHHDTLAGDAPIALAGTSFSGVAALDSLIARETGMPVRNGARGAVGAIAPLRGVLEQARTAGMPRILFWEIPNHLLVCAHGADIHLREFLAELPLARGEPPFVAAAPAFLTLLKNGNLKAGRQDFASPWAATWVAAGVLRHPGNGMVGARLRGTVARGAVRVVVRCGGEATSALWMAGAPECFVGGVTAAPTADLLVAINRETADAELDLTGVEVACDVDCGNAAALQIDPVRPAGSGWSQEARFPSAASIARHSAGVLILNVAGGARGAISVEAVLADGRGRQLLAPAPLVAESALFVDLNAVAGERVAGLRLIGAGAPPSRVLVSARCAPQLRR